MIIDQNDPSPNVAVIGLGKIGLTLAAVFANRGYNVIGADLNPVVAQSVNQGNSHIDNEPGLADLVATAHRNHTLKATTQTREAVATAKIILVIVPILVDEQNNTNYEYIDLAVQEIAQGIQKDALVIFETTIPPGDTKNRFGKMIEDISGLSMGSDFYLVYSPERVYSNQIIQDLQTYPKVVGGLNEKSLDLAAAFYNKALGCELMKVSSLEAAEFAKIAECVYRDVNIALANELAQFAEKQGVCMSEVIQASNSQPYSNIHKPGIGVGGHCIPIYPHFFLNKGLTNGLTALSREINDQMASYAISKTEKAIGPLQGKNILILGLSYRGNVKEATKSITLQLIDLLKDKKAIIWVNDPLFTDGEIESYGISPLSLESEKIAEMDIVILQAFHQEYVRLNFHDFTQCKLVLDGRNKLNKKAISELGILYETIGN